MRISASSASLQPCSMRRCQEHHSKDAGLQCQLHILCKQQQIAYMLIFTVIKGSTPSVAAGVVAAGALGNDAPQIPADVKCPVEGDIQSLRTAMMPLFDKIIWGTGRLAGPARQLEALACYGAPAWCSRSAELLPPMWR